MIFLPPRVTSAVRGLHSQTQPNETAPTKVSAAEQR